MGETSMSQDSSSDSARSKSSVDVLIAKSSQPKSKTFEFSKKDKKTSKKQKDSYDFLDGSSEEQKNSFKWIPNPTESFLSETKEEHKKRHQRQPSVLRGVGGVPAVSTLDSDKTDKTDKTLSSYTASDFTSNSYGHNGYIRGSRGKTEGVLKYNEFSSLMSSLGAVSNFPVEVKLDEEERKRKERNNRVEEENSAFLITGGMQMMLGILMAVFGVLVIVHDASLAGAGSGLWGGAVALLSGLLGVLAGLKGCYSSSSDGSNGKVSPALLTAFLALCLVSFALSNLVLVLTATGLIRDIQRPHLVEEELALSTEAEVEPGTVNWAPVMADAGLILAAAMQCVLAIMSGYKCYKRVCPCLRRNHDRLSETDSNTEMYKAEGKDRLVNHWLGQQVMVPVKSKKKRSGEDARGPWATPNIVFLPPPPPMITSGQVPILTFLQAPSSVLNSSLYAGHTPAPPCSAHMYGCCCHHEERFLQDRRTPRRLAYISPDPKVPRSRSKSRETKKERRASLPTAEDVARTYTGLDREIAEEFIAIAMDKGRRASRRNSLSTSRVGY